MLLNIDCSATHFICSPFKTTYHVYGIKYMIKTDGKRNENYTLFVTYKASKYFFKPVPAAPYVHVYFQSLGSRSVIFNADTRQNEDAVCDQN